MNTWRHARNLNWLRNKQDFSDQEGVNKQKQRGVGGLRVVAGSEPSRGSEQVRRTQSEMRQPIDRTPWGQFGVRVRGGENCRLREHAVRGREGAARLAFVAVFFKRRTTFLAGTFGVEIVVPVVIDAFEAATRF